jgi:hypothetical protein
MSDEIDVTSLLVERFTNLIEDYSLDTGEPAFERHSHRLACVLVGSLGITNQEEPREEVR